MKKIFMTLIASMLLLSSTTYAVEMSKTHNPVNQMMTMSKADAQQMFDKAGIDMSKAKVLDSGEMAKTEGEWWWAFYGAAWGTAAYWAYDYTHNGYGYR